MRAPEPKEDARQVGCELSPQEEKSKPVIEMPPVSPGDAARNASAMELDLEIMPEYMDVMEVEKRMQTIIQRGLSDAEVAHRREKYGENILVGINDVSPLALFFQHLFNFMTVVLIVAFTLTMVTEKYIEATVIIVVIVSNTLIGFVQELHASQAMKALRQICAPTCTVLRDGHQTIVPATELVLGDIIFIRRGDVVPADVRLFNRNKYQLNCYNSDVSVHFDFAADEAPLTGESMPASKHDLKIAMAVDVAGLAVYGQEMSAEQKHQEQGQQVQEQEEQQYQPVCRSASLLDRRNLAFMGTTVVRGRAGGIVTHKGMHTELGKIASNIAVVSPRTALQVQLDYLAFFLFVVAIVFSVIVILSNHTRSTEVYLYAIAVAISIIPEGLVAIVAVAHSSGANFMHQKHVIIRKLAALEALSAVTDICSDKTGTITTGVMEVKLVWLPCKAGNRFLCMTPGGFIHRQEQGQSCGGEKSPQSADSPLHSSSSSSSSGSASSSSSLPSPTDTAVALEAAGGAIHSSPSGDGAIVDAEVDTALKALVVVCAMNNNATDKVRLDDDVPASAVRSVAPDSNLPPTVYAGDPTEVALLKMTKVVGLTKERMMNISNMDHRLQLIVEFPFESSLKRMTSVYRTKDAATGKQLQRTFMKGGLESIYQYCKFIQIGESIEPLCVSGLASGPPSRKPSFLDADIPVHLPAATAAAVSSSSSHSSPFQRNEVSTELGRVRSAQLAALVREQREHMEDLKYRLKSLQEKLPDSYRVLAVAHRIDEVYEDEFTKELFVMMQKKKEEATMPRPGMQSSSSSAGAASFFVPPPSSSSFSSLIPAIHSESDRVDIEKGLVFLGLIGIHDPPKPQSRAAVEAAKGGGIAVRMITGDSLQTATAIALQTRILLHADERLDPLKCTTADQFDACDDEDLDSVRSLPLVIARCSPHTKVKLVRALQRRHRVVAMTGDGVNDCPSLKAANVSIAMNSGAQIAKKVSSMVIVDDDFSTIIQAIMQGRRISDNIVKFVVHLMSCNVAECIVLLCGLAFVDSKGLSIFPLAPLQILWVNLVSSSPPALALATEPAQNNIMRRMPSRPNVLMDHLLWIDVVVYGVVIGVLTLVNFIIVVFVVEAHASAPAVLGTRQAERCNTDYTSETCAYIFRGRGCAFGSLIVLVLLHAYVCKDLHLSIFHMNITDNRFLALTFFLGLAILPLTYYVSFLCNQWFYQAPITWEWGLIVLSGIVFLLFSECYKACIRKRLFLSEEDELRRRANENRVEIDIDQQGDELVLVRDTNNKTNLNRREHNVMNATH